MIRTEKAVLATVIFENSLASLLLANADKSLFSSHYNQIIFEEIEKLHKEKQFFDVLILTDRLSNKIPFLYVVSLMDCLVHSSLKFLFNDLKLYLNTLRRERAKREILKEVSKQAKAPTVDLDEMQKAMARANLLDAEIETGGMEDCFEELDQISGKNKAITLGFPTLDSAIGGFRYGELLLFMARTGVGKTFWVLNVIFHLILNKQEKIALFSLEMPRVSVLERLTQIDFSLSRNQALGKLKTDEKMKPRIVNKLKNLRIYTQNYSVEEIELKIREASSRIVFIDYLDLLNEQSSRHQTRYERISNLIIELKRIAKRQDSLLIVIHQLQRQAEEGSVPVRLTMARDSGVIEEASDFILGAWRPELGYDDETKVPEDMKNRLFIKLLKNKRGPTKNVSGFFDKKTGKMWEIEWNDLDMERNNAK
jgi:replicative DNA helicase